jgi:hypothetical protein
VRLGAGYTVERTRRAPDPAECPSWSQTERYEENPACKNGEREADGHER